MSERPPLPEPVGHVHSNGDWCWDRNPGLQTWPLYLHTADQLRTYGDDREAQGRRKGMEEAYNAMFSIKGCKVTRFDAQTAIRSLAGKEGS